MPTNYITTIEYTQPTYVGYTATDPENYSTINWGSNTPIAQATLDAAWAAAELNQEKNNKKLALRVERNSRMYRTTSYGVNDYEGKIDHILYLVYAMAYVNAGNSLPVDFKLSTGGGSGITSNATDVETLLGNVLQNWKGFMDTYTSKCATVDACSDVACVNAVTWS